MKKLAFLITIMTLLYACSKDSEVILDIAFEQNKLTLKMGDETPLQVKHTPSSLSAPEYQWESSDPSIVSVKDGYAKALKVGKSTITVTAKNLQLKSSIDITVIPIKATSITIEPDIVELKIGEKQQLNYTIKPDNTTDKEVEWFSINDDVATVKDGLVTAVGLGETKIQCKLKGSDLIGHSLITTRPIKIEAIELNKQELNMLIGQEETIIATITPQNATNKDIEWESTNKNVAIVKNGIISAIAEGTTEVIAKTIDGNISSKCRVEVKPIMVEAIKLNKQELNMFIGQEETIIATITPQNATNKDIEWESTNKNVAIVKNGIISAIAEGTTEVIAKTIDGNISSKCRVEVKPIMVEAIKLNKQELNMFIGQEETIIATITPQNATNKDIEWESTNKNVAIVKNGIISAIAEGTTEVIAKTIDGNISSKCRVEVKPIMVEAIKLNKQELNMFIGQEETIIATITPQNATNKDIEWESTNKNVAIVKNGIISAIAEGTTEVIAKTIDGNISSKCRVEVKPIMVEAIKLNKQELNMFIGQEETIIATITPQNATNKDIEWESTNKNVAIVKNGIISAIAEGTTEVIAKTIDGNISSKCRVEVKPIMVEAIELNKQELNMLIGQEETIIATITPQNATNKDIEWESTNKNVAIVKNGIISAIAEGTTEVIAKTIDGNISSKCRVEVKPIMVEAISLNLTNLVLEENEKEQLKATITPQNATNKELMWESSNPSIVKVDQNGLITALAIGEAQITASTKKDNHQAICTVKVNPISVKNIELNSTRKSVLIDESFQLYSTIYPQNAANQKVYWKSSNEEVATVDEQGNVKTHKKGYTIITVSSMENNNISAECYITVKDITDFISSHFPSKSIMNIGGVVSSSFSVSLANNSNSSIEYTRFEVKDETGKTLLYNEEIQELSSFQTLTLKGSVRNAINPKVFWTYKHKGKIYTLSLPIAD